MTAGTAGRDIHAALTLRLPGRAITAARCFCAAVALTLVAGSASAQVLRGRVVDASSSAPLGGVEITLRADGSVVARTASDSAGYFVLRTPGRAEYRLSASLIGYATIDSIAVPVQQTEVEVTIRMATAAVPLDAVIVTADGHIHARHLATFDGFLARLGERRHIGNKRVVLQDEPEMQSAVRVTDVLRWFPRTRKCLTVYLDGRELSYPVGEISVALLRGIEYYRHYDDAPLEFRNGKLCSVAALWSDRPEYRR